MPRDLASQKRNVLTVVGLFWRGTAISVLVTKKIESGPLW